ncbi:MAG TPA: hypothetical protein VN495_01350 [Candidatus Paceibacterota bacterium]|nr:hypothetical protein [Candidatus Paceibacterota bacterium]
MASLYPAKEKNLEFIATLRAKGVLEDLQEGEFPSEFLLGDQFCCCTDCDQFDDLYSHHRATSGHRRHGPIALYGGVLLIPDEIGDPQGLHILNNLWLGYSLNKGRAIVLVTHLPCAWSRMHKLTHADVVYLGGKAKSAVIDYFDQRIAEEPQHGVPRPNVMVHCHIDHGMLGDERPRRRTYHVNRHQLNNVIHVAQFNGELTVGK